MIAILYLNWFSGKPPNEDSSEFNDIPDYHVSVQAFLEHYGIDKDAIVIKHYFESETPDDYFHRHRISENSIQFPDAEMRAEASHRRQARSIILWVLAVPMSVIPIWIMVLLTLPVLNKEANVSQPMQAAYLAAVATDFVGLYYIITRDLFPQGGRRTSRKSKKRERQDDEDSNS
ncbi:MAG: hypothetical protein F6K19_23400 [Cyanothece sp. SIO1E1]|nr:hypothetical protein [Cyanothece sp. SIO1E1]